LKTEKEVEAQPELMQSKRASALSEEVETLR